MKTERPHALDLSQGSLTKQSFKDECNINKIMDKFQRTGVIQHYAAHAPTYGDASPIEYLDALQTIATANEMFDDLPSSVRKRFNNNPEEFLEFVQNPSNLEECQQMGLAPSLTLSDNKPDKTHKKPVSTATEPSEAPKTKDDG